MANARAIDALRERWMQSWPTALAAWSRFTRLRPPLLCATSAEAKREGLAGSFAMIRLTDQTIVIDLPQVHALGLDDYAKTILAHEIGHHVFAPATLTDHARMLARMRFALPTLELHAPMIANLYTDLFINDRLQRSAELPVVEVYRRIGSGAKTGRLWQLYMRVCELLWRLDRGALGGGGGDRLEGDALLGSRLIRSYAREHLQGAGRFAALLLPYLLEDKDTAALIERLFDTRSAGAGGDPTGLTVADGDERDGAIHPAEDPELTDEEDGKAQAKVPKRDAPQRRAGDQARQPFEYGELLRAAGLDIDDHEAAVRYYRERALPHLVPFPSLRPTESTDPLPEGLEPWELGDPFDTVDWMQTIIASPHVVPGMTTVRRVWGTTEGAEPKREPLDLDLYVDSSGSMENPQKFESFPALAGAIICLSALRAGASVQATLWSGKHEFFSTPGFVRDERKILRVLTGFFGGGTAFPIHVLRDTFAKRRADARPVHVLIISDDGVSTLFENDERGNSGWDVSRVALERARGGGTMVLNLGDQWESVAHKIPSHAAIRRARDEFGWQVHRVANWDDLVAFARAFSRARFGEAEATVVAT